MILLQYWKTGLCIVGGITLLAVANFHLVYVAVTSQPTCVAHHKVTNNSASKTQSAYRAAKSSC